MIKYLIMFCLVLNIGYAEAATINKKYSFGDFTGQSFKDRPASDFNDTIIKGSSFYQEWKEGDVSVVKDIFPDGMIGVIFQRCNLDNVLIPKDNIVESADGVDSTNKKIKVQNDLEDWVLDKSFIPTEPMNKNKFIELGISIDPLDIPPTKLEKPITVKKEELLNAESIPIIN